MGISRRELFDALGASPRPKLVDSLLDRGYKAMSDHEWRQDLDRSPHGVPWHTSFHASRFPGDDPKACGRQAMYDFMGLPRGEAIDRRGRTIMDAGKDLEVQQVTRLHFDGSLISEPPWSRVQTGFVLPEYWLTGNCDAVVLPDDYTSPHIVEFKGKDDEAVQKMWRKEQTFDAVHRHQVLAYIGMARYVHEDHWPLLFPASDGTLIYVSRNRPYNTMEYHFDHNPDFWQAGLARLKQWQDFFIIGELPPRDKSWRWTEPPCKWCHVKRICKADQKAGTVKMHESIAIDTAKALMPAYDYAQARQDVLTRWNV